MIKVDNKDPEYDWLKFWEWLILQNNDGLIKEEIIIVVWQRMIMIDWNFRILKVVKIVLIDKGRWWH